MPECATYNTQHDDMQISMFAMMDSKGRIEHWLHLSSNHHYIEDQYTVIQEQGHISRNRLFKAALPLTVIVFLFDLCQTDSGFTFKYLRARIRTHWHITYPPG